MSREIAKLAKYTTHRGAAFAAAAGSSVDLAERGIQRSARVIVATVLCLRCLLYAAISATCSGLKENFN